MQTLAIRLHPYAVIFGAIILNECYAELGFDNWRFVLLFPVDLKSQNHRMAWVGRDPKDHRLQPPATGRATNLQMWY